MYPSSSSNTLSFGNQLKLGASDAVISQNTEKYHLTTKDSSQRSKPSSEDLDVNSKQRFQIDKDLASFLGIDEWCSFREITLGFLKFNKKTKGDFYDRNTTSFNAYKYPYFLQFFPHLLDAKSKKQ